MYSGQDLLPKIKNMGCGKPRPLLGQFMTDEPDGRGGRRARSGRKKGGTNQAGKVVRLTASLPIVLWDALNEAAKQDRKTRRSRYIDLLTSAVIREEVDIDIDPNGLPPDMKSRWLELTSRRAEKRGGYFSLRKETWEDLKTLQGTLGWSRAALLRKLFASQLILPPEERVRLDTLSPKRKPRPAGVVPTENPFVYRPIEEPQTPDQAPLFWDEGLPDMDDPDPKEVEKIENSNSCLPKIVLYWAKRGKK